MRTDKDLVDDLNYLQRFLKELIGDSDNIYISLSKLGRDIDWNAMKVHRLIKRLSDLNRISVVIGKGRKPSEITIISSGEISEEEYVERRNKSQQKHEKSSGEILIDKHMIDELITKVKTQFDEIKMLKKEIKKLQENNDKLENSLILLEEKEFIVSHNKKSLEDIISQTLSLGEEDKE